MRTNPFEIVELDLDGPKEGEILVRYVTAGLCQPDLHLVDGDIEPRFPIVGGHEGAGIVEEVGPGVTTVEQGDHVVCSFIPSCGHCRYCSTGRQSLCDLGASIGVGCLPDLTFRMHRDGEDVGGKCMLGTFSQYGTISQHSVVKIDPSIPLEIAVLVGCGVPTGWGTAVYAGGVRPGDTVVVYGIGGVGINSVQGAVHTGAVNVVVVDPVAFKRDTAMKMGATHAFANAEQAREAIVDMTRGQGADQALITVGTVDSAVVTAAFDTVGKGGTVVITGLANPGLGWPTRRSRRSRRGGASSTPPTSAAPSRRSSATPPPTSADTAGRTAPPRPRRSSGRFTVRRFDDPGGLCGCARFRSVDPLHLTFRSATRADVPALVALVESAYRGEASRAGWTTEADLLGGQRTDPDMVAAVVADERGRMLIAEAGGAPLACCQLENREGDAYFGMFAVDPGSQGGGLGRRVLAEAERLAREEWDAKEMRMTVITAREELIAWYVRRGYIRTGETSPFPYGDERFGLPKRDDLEFEFLVKKLG